MAAKAALIFLAGRQVVASNSWKVELYNATTALALVPPDFATTTPGGIPYPFYAQADSFGLSKHMVGLTNGPASCFLGLPR